MVSLDSEAEGEEGKCPKSSQTAALFKGFPFETKYPARSPNPEGPGRLSDSAEGRTGSGGGLTGFCCFFFSSIPLVWMDGRSFAWEAIA